jgi:hypothetical protein
MKKTFPGAIIACLFFCLRPAGAQAQSEAPAEMNFYWVAFKDKANTPYTADAPEAFLSERAINRRQRLRIPINAQDFPPNPSYLDIMQLRGAKVHHTSRWLNAATVYGDSTILGSIAELSFVDTVWYAGPFRPKAEAKTAAPKKMDKLKSKALEGQGLKRMASTGEVFNADLYEAITEIPSPDMAGKVVDTVETGYTLNEKIIRHAKVVVGK